MRPRYYITVGIAAMLVAAPGIPGEEKASKLPGQSIAERNVFNLKPPTPPAPPPAPPKPTAKVYLTGILNLMGPKRAVLQVTDVGKSQHESKILQEGERDGDLEVLQIDEVAETVRIRLRDEERELDFKKDGLAVPTAPASAFAMPTNLAMGVRPPVGSGLTGPGSGVAMPVQPPPNLPPGTIWRPDGTMIPPGAAPAYVITNPPAYQPPTRVIRTP